jgi:uncharacterized membrane protein HdeD (DUF308 family)
MESVVQRATKATKGDINKVRWALGISGALSIAFAVVILIWPGISLYALVLLFGAYSLANGVIMLGTAITGRVKESRGWLVAAGLAASPSACSSFSGRACPRSPCST